METLRDLHQTIGGQLLPKAPTADALGLPLGRIVTDSRRIERGDVFWALKGGNHDGASFVDEAFRRGADGVIAAAPVEVPDNRWAVHVEDTCAALTQWARFKRRRFTGTLIAVTGSVGKTTTRQMIHTVLRTRLAGSASPRNFNNHLGVPLSMLAIEPCHDYAVLELGANRRGEIAELAELCTPKVGVITRIGEAHLGGFGSRQAVAETKAELLAALPSTGHAVLVDDPWLHAVASRCAAPITWIGVSPQCNLRALDVKSEQGRLSFRLMPGLPEDAMPDARHASDQISQGIANAPPTIGIDRDSTIRFSIPVWGRHHLTAALAAVTVGRMMGFDLEEIATALEHFQPVPMRCEVVEIRGATIINDAYNSNPTAMNAALELLRDFDAPGRRIVVCGDMAELGAQSIALHWQLGKEIVQLGGAQLLIACGQFARHVTAGARAAGLIRSRAIPCDTVDSALPLLGQAMLPGDVVLVKGSRMMGMERVVEALKQYPQRRSA